MNSPFYYEEQREAQHPQADWRHKHYARYYLR